MSADAATPAPAPTIDRDALASRALPPAYALAKRFGGTNRRLAEDLRDVATEAVCLALNEFDPAKGDWLAFAMSFVRRRVMTAAGRGVQRQSHQGTPRQFAEKGEDFPERRPDTGGRIPMSAELRDLPPDLRDAVRLYYIDGYSQVDVGLLCGVSQEEIRRRLHEAAVLLRGEGEAKTVSGRVIQAGRLKRA